MCHDICHATQRAHPYSFQKLHLPPSIFVELNKHIGKCSSAMTRLSSKIWTNSLRLTPGFKCTKPVSSVSCCTAMSHGHHTEGTSGVPTHLTYVPSGASLARNCRNTSQMQKYSSRQTLSACLLSSTSAVCPHVSRGGRSNYQKHPL